MIIEILLYSYHMHLASNKQGQLWKLTDVEPKGKSLQFLKNHEDCFYHYYTFYKNWSQWFSNAKSVYTEQWLINACTSKSKRLSIHFIENLNTFISLILNHWKENLTISKADSFQMNGGRWLAAATPEGSSWKEKTKKPGDEWHVG